MTTFTFDLAGIEAAELDADERAYVEHHIAQDAQRADFAYLGRDLETYEPGRIVLVEGDRVIADVAEKPPRWWRLRARAVRNASERRALAISTGRGRRPRARQRRSTRRVSRASADDDAGGGEPGLEPSAKRAA